MSELKRFLREAGFDALALAGLVVVIVLLWSCAGCEPVDDCPDCPGDGQCTCDVDWAPDLTDEWPPELRPQPPEANPYYDAPPADVPLRFRVSNYAGGSCNHAAMQQVLRWQGLGEVADWWRKTYSGAESAEGLASKANAKGLRFAATFDGDAEFLEWCSRTRRGAAIHYGDAHAQTFLGFTSSGAAIVLDNNATGRYSRIPKAVFLARWRGWGGKAITVVYTPPPPRPWVPRS